MFNNAVFVDNTNSNSIYIFVVPGTSHMSFNIRLKRIENESYIMRYYITRHNEIFIIFNDHATAVDLRTGKLVYRIYFDEEFDCTDCILYNFDRLVEISKDNVLRIYDPLPSPAATLLSLVVLVSDDYLKIKAEAHKPLYTEYEIKAAVRKQKIARFFEITKRLPLELQNLVCNRVMETKDRNILGNEITIGTRLNFAMFSAQKEK
jgi:hypothetical protein